MSNIKINKKAGDRVLNEKLKQKRNGKKWFEKRNYLDDYPGGYWYSYANESC